VHDRYVWSHYTIQSTYQCPPIPQLVPMLSSRVIHNSNELRRRIFVNDRWRCPALPPHSYNHAPCCAVVMRTRTVTLSPLSNGEDIYMRWVHRLYWTSSFLKTLNVRRTRVQCVLKIAAIVSVISTALWRVFHFTGNYCRE